MLGASVGSFIALFVIATGPQDSACEPPCRSGYACLHGKCVELCNPPCRTDERCTGEGECVLRVSAATSKDTLADAKQQSVPVAPTAFVNVRCNWGSRNVFVDDALVGSTPLKVAVSPGAHVVSLCTSAELLGLQQQVATLQSKPNSGPLYGDYHSVGMAVKADYLERSRVTVTINSGEACIYYGFWCDSRRRGLSDCHGDEVRMNVVTGEAACRF